MPDLSNAAHVHLLVNHFPIIGAFLGVLLTAVALLRRADRGVLLSAVIVLVVTGVGGMAASWTGEPAMGQIEEMDQAIEASEELGQHEERGEFAALVSAGTALLAIAILWAAWRRPVGEPTPALWIAIVLVAAIVTAALMARTGAIGGLVMHREVRPPEMRDR